MMYSKTVMDHFRNPRNVGVMEDADGVGEVGNPLCGDMMTIYLKINDDRIEDIKFQTFGCGSAIAVSSMLTEIAKGKTIARSQSHHQQRRGRSAGRSAQKQAALLQSGRGRPPDGHQELRRRRGRHHPSGGRSTRKPTITHEGGKCYCPYCDVEIQEDITFCEACQSSLEEEH